MGGWIQTKHEGQALFECGPRSLRTAGSGIAILKLIESLGIQDAVIESAKEAKIRYLARNGALCPLPYGIASFFRSPFAFTIVKGVLRNLCTSKSKSGDETVSHFFTHRFGQAFHDTFIDPLTAGIYAAAPELLSMQSTLGSISKKSEPCSKWVRSMKHKMISFYDGIQFLPNTLKSMLKAEIFCSTPVRMIVEGASKIAVVTDHKTFEVDHVVSALPAQALLPLLSGDDPVKSILADFSSTSVVTVSLGWHTVEKIPAGFGFLCASREEKELLGIVFDSNVFAAHNGQFPLRLSVMMGGTRAPEMQALDESSLQDMAHHFVKKYLKITTSAHFCHVQKAQNAIGLYTAGQKARCAALTDSTQGRKISILGASFSGVSVGDCIQAAQTFTKKPCYT